MKSFKLVRNVFLIEPGKNLTILFPTSVTVSVSDPDSIRSLDPGLESDPDTDPGGENNPQK